VVNRVVDIGDYIDPKGLGESGKCDAGACRQYGEQLRQKLAAQGERVPSLGNATPIGPARGIIRPCHGWRGSKSIVGSASANV